MSDTIKELFHCDNCLSLHSKLQKAEADIQDYIKQKGERLLYISELQKKLDVAVEVIKEANEYLNYNELTMICHGSKLHKKFKETLKTIEKEDKAE